MRRIILASGSPRRKELVAQMGFVFEVVPSNFEERLDDSRDMEEVAKELGLGKALDVATRYPEVLVIGSDTIAMLDGKQLGKYSDPAEAKELLRRMSGKRVEVISSVALVCKESGIQEVRAARAAIVYASYGDDAIDRWLATDHWRDKAGATGVQHNETPPVDHLEGDYDTILGISTRLLQEMLAAQGVQCKRVHLRPPHTIRALAPTASNAL
jgi:septum formation protein